MITSKQFQTQLNNEIQNIEKKKLDINQLETTLQKQLEKYSTQRDLNSVKDLINTLANEQNEELQHLKQEQILPLQQKNHEILLQIEEIVRNKPPPLPSEPVVTCYGADQSARISSLELQQVKLEYLPQSIEDIRRLILKLEEQSFQIMKINLNNENKINKLENEENKLENVQNKQMKLIEQIQSTIGTINTTIKSTQQEINEKLHLKVTKEDINKIIKENNENLLKEFEEKQLNSNLNNETIELIKEYCKELEKRLLLLASECRDGLEYIQNTNQEQYEALIKWIDKNIKNGLTIAATAAAASMQNSNNSTDIGVKCLACNRETSNGTNSKTFFQNYTFPCKYKYK